jgi:Zn-dependent protease with chaperone function
MGAVFLGSMSAQDVDPEGTHYLQSLMERLKGCARQLPYPFKIHIRRAPQINAVALPGGHIVVFTGLLEKVGSENELAFVLAHEMGHYAHRDHLRGFGRAFVFLTLSAFLFGSDSSITSLLGHSLNMTALSFSRKQETYADEFALQTLNCAYGHASGGTDFFERIPREKDPGEFGHYFASHPENRRRISHLRDITRKNGYRLAKRKPLPEVLQKWKQ